MKNLKTQDERDSEAETRANLEKCCCGKNKAIGAWGLRVGYSAPFGYTPKIPYCREHLSDMIDGLELVVKDLKQLRKKY